MVYMNLSQSLGSLSHHAYGIVSDISLRLDIISFLEGEHGVVQHGNPDFFMQKYEVLTIDDARALKELHATRPFTEKGRKFFILEIDSITREAQNALLKIFEEPNEYAHFFLIIPSEELLLPTLRSRLFIVKMTSRTRQDDISYTSDFLASLPAERIALVDKLAADISDGKKPKTAALDFCADLSRHIRVGGIEKNAAALAALAQTESYLRDRAPSVKQLLEYVALSV
jgi:site-specific DNA-cytosine methylase